MVHLLKSTQPTVNRNKHRRINSLMGFQATSIWQGVKLQTNASRRKDTVALGLVPRREEANAQFFSTTRCIHFVKSYKFLSFALTAAHALL